MLKVLITGASGLVGRFLLSSTPEGIEVYTIARSSIPESDQHTILDLSDQPALERWLNQTSPDAIINVAGVTSIGAAMDNREYASLLNGHIPELMAKWTKKNGKKLIHFSTDFVFDGLKGMYSESDSPAPISTYGRTKLLGEQLVLEADPTACVVRTVLVYGFRNDLSRLNFPLWLRVNLMRGKSLEITSDQWRTPTYAGDLASATWSLLASNHTGLIHLSGPEQINVYDWALRIARHFELDESLLSPVTSNAIAKGEHRPLKTGFDITLARQQLGYHPMGIDLGLHQLSDSLGHPTRS